jgi:hypothetical protein
MTCVFDPSEPSARVATVTNCYARNTSRAELRDGGAARSQADRMARRLLQVTIMCEAKPSLEGDLILNQRERKFILDAHTAFSFWEIASSRLRPHCRDASRPLSFVRTTYFDTADRAYYRGLAGGGRRLRAREYASAIEPNEIPELTGVCVLELKQTTAGMRSKSRLSMPAGDVGAYLARLTGGRSDAALMPCLTTWYQRAALTDGDDRLRVTLDQRIRFCAPTPVGAPCTGVEPGGVIANGPDFVLELKLWDEPPAWLARAIRGLHEAIGFSKFDAGMRAAEAAGVTPEYVQDAISDEHAAAVLSA